MTSPQGNEQKQFLMLRFPAAAVKSPATTSNRRSRAAGRRSTTPGTASSRASSSGGISASVSRIRIGSTGARAGLLQVSGAGATPENGADSTPATRAHSTPATRADSTPATRVGLTKLYISDEGFLLPPKVVPQACTRIFKKIKNDTGYTWDLSSDEIIKDYWEEFKKYFRWHPDLERVIREKWEEKARKRYRDFCHGMKLKAEAAEDKIAAKPPYITSSAWLGWLEYWQRDDVLAKSKMAKRCRMSEPEGPGTGRIIHRGGSKSIVQFAYELGCTVRECLYNAYCMSHKNSDGSYTDVRSAKIGRMIEARVAELGSPLPGTTEEREVDWNQAFLDVVPLDAKNRMFGTGELARMISRDVSVGTSQNHTASACDSRLTEMELQLSTEREERELLKVETQKLQEAVHSQKLLIERLLSQQQHTSSGCPPP